MAGWPSIGACDSLGELLDGPVGSLVDGLLGTSKVEGLDTSGSLHTGTSPDHQNLEVSQHELEPPAPRPPPPRLTEMVVLAT